MGTATAAADERYASGDYLAATGGTWHLEDAPFKASQVMRMLDRHPEVKPATVCEIGCGAGGVLAQLRDRMPGHVQFAGYEISPQAHEMSKQFADARLRFVPGDAFTDGVTYDLALVLDVIEHVEDPFAFVRQVKPKGRYQMYHIPLDISVSATLRDSYLNAWKSVGHVHVFSRALALETLRSTGHEIIDYFYTPGALNIGRGWKSKLGNLPRRVLPQSLASRLVGGFSLMVLTR